MTYKTKNELEEGSYIVYTDEPGVIYDDSGSGGGGGGGDFGDLVFVRVREGSSDKGFSVTNISLGDTVIYSNEVNNDFYIYTAKIAANTEVTLYYYMDSSYRLVGVFSGKYDEENTPVEYDTDSPLNHITFTVPQVEGEQPSISVKFEYQE